MQVMIFKNTCSEKKLRNFNSQSLSQGKMLATTLKSDSIFPFYATVHFLYPLKYKKSRGFHMFSGGMKRDQWLEMGYLISAKCYML